MWYNIYIGEILESIVTLVMWVQAITILVSTASVVVAYLIHRDEKLRHVLPLALSHLIFITLSITGLHLGRYQLHEWRGVLNFVAFTLTTYGLGYLLWKKAVPKMFPKRFGHIDGKTDPGFISD